MTAWHRTTDPVGRSMYVLAGSGMGVVRIEGVWFVQNLATGENQTWRTALTDAKAAAEFAGGAA